MKKLFFPLVLLPFLMSAQAPAGYYSGTAGLTGYALKSRVKEIISNHISWNYSDLPTLYQQTDLDIYYDHSPADNPQNGNFILLDIYSEKPAAPDSYEYTSTQVIANSSAEGLGYNREHMMPQSSFKLGSLSAYPMYSDLMFVIPADARINQLRQNYPYGPAGSTSYYTFSNGSKVTNFSVPGLAYTGRTYAPIEEFRGDIARSLLYFITRYEDKLDSFNYTSNANPAQDVSMLDGTLERGLEPAYIEMLKLWHQQDPVSQREITRNNAVYAIQGNRNPFIDNPDWVNLIWQSPISTVAPTAPQNVRVTATGKNFLKVEWEGDATGTVLGYEITSGTSTLRTHQNFAYIDRLQPSSTNTVSVRAYNAAYLFSPNNSVTATTAAADGFAPDLFISAYWEGSGQNKAVEITNQTGHPVRLDHYNLNVQYYNSTSGTYYFGDTYRLEGVLENGMKKTILHPLATLTCLQSAQNLTKTAAPAMNFSGTQYVELAYRGLQTVDAIGVKGTANSLADVTLKRNPGVSAPSAQYDASQWTVLPADACISASLSVQEVAKKSAFSVSPNPFTESFIVESDNAQAIKLYDAAGRLVPTTIEKKTVNLYKITLQKAMPGVYFLQNGQEGIKVIKR